MNSKTLFYVLKRIGLAILTIWVVITITFFVMHAVPGGPFVGEKATTPAVQAAMEAKYGLDKPVLEQYFTYLGDIVLRFDFGPSLKQRGRQVIDIIADGMKVSAKLGLIAAFGALVVGIVLGAVAALRRNKVIDKVIMVITTAFVSMPSFIAGALLLTIFAVSLHLLPANGAQKNGLILPVVTLALYPMAYITRLTRSSMLDVLGQDYIRTARAKGLREMAIVRKHALKNALIPVITMIGGQVSMVIGGNVIIESIFNIPGLGSLMVTGINNRDYPTIMGITLVIAIFVCCMNLLVDLAYAAIDPRIKAQFSGGNKRRKKAAKTEEVKA